MTWIFVIEHVSTTSFFWLCLGRRYNRCKSLCSYSLISASLPSIAVRCLVAGLKHSHWFQSGSNCWRYMSTAICIIIGASHHTCMYIHPSTCMQWLSQSIWFLSTARISDNVFPSAPPVKVLQVHDSEPFLTLCRERKEECGCHYPSDCLDSAQSTGMVCMGSHACKL